jgi:tRNA threonylcarbamoyladenosine biosynthesis protein TsaB
MPTLALALDTSTPVLSSALVVWEAHGLRVLATREAGPPQITSTLMPGLFDELLTEAGFTLGDVQVLVSGLGPGLFTGARVAVATMKAIAYARQLPLVGAGSLEAMALAGARGAPMQVGDALSEVADSPVLCPIIDARKGEVYFALYRFEGGAVRVIEEPQAGPPAALVARLQTITAPVRFFGTGVKAMGRVLPSGGGYTAHPRRG